MTKISIKNWPEEDRPREKLLQKGAAALTDAELIAILIRAGSSNESAVQLSQRILLSVNNNLNELAKISVPGLTKQFHGIGEAKALTIAAALEFGKRRGSSEIQKKSQIKSSYDVWQYFYPMLADLPYEELWALFVNQSSGIIKHIKVSQGGISCTVADIRMILKPAVEILASGIILCHNHPSGNLKPSREDDQLTERLKQAVKLLDMNLLDHIVLTDASWYSYADDRRIL